MSWVATRAWKISFRCGIVRRLLAMVSSSEGQNAAVNQNNSQSHQNTRQERFYRKALYYFPIFSIRRKDGFGRKNPRFFPGLPWGTVVFNVTKGNNAKIGRNLSCEKALKRFSTWNGMLKLIHELKQMKNEELRTDNEEFFSKMPHQRPVLHSQFFVLHSSFF